MASTFTPNLNLNCQAVGDASNTWGTVLNASVFTNVDQALGGSYSTSVAGNSDFTLSQSNALNIEHILTGVLTGSINYVFPASAGRIVKIVNNTTGAFTVTVKQSGGTGCVAPQGETSLMSLSANTTITTQLLTNLGNSPSVGAPSGTTGGLRFYNANNTNVTTIKSGTSTAPWTLTLPVGPGSANQILVTDGTGNASWGTANTSLAAIANNSVLANISGTSAVPTGTTVTAVMNSALGSSVGAIALRGTSTWGALAAGTSTNFYLQAQGTNIPSWGTVAMTDPGSSLGTSGYQKFPSGLIYQWGQTTSAAIASAGTVSFPTNFASKCFGVNLTFNHPSDYGALNAGYSTINTVGTSNFTTVFTAGWFWQAWGQ